MKVELGGFEISKSIGIDLYDIAKVGIVSSGKSKGKKSLKPIAYGIPVSKCFKVIRDSLLEEFDSNEEITNIERFSELFEKCTEKLIKESQSLEATLREVVKSSK